MLQRCVLVLLLLAVPLMPRESSARPVTSSGSKGDLVRRFPKTDDERIGYLVKYGHLTISANQMTGIDVLHKSIADLQRFAGIPVTGEMDEATDALMAIPRCGLPDVIESTTKNRRKRFVAHGSKWLRTTLTYFFQNYTSKLETNVTREVIATALQMWSDVVPLDFTELPPQTKSGDIRVLFARGSHGDSADFDGPGGVLGHAYFPTSGATHFDEDEAWTNGVKAGINLLQVVTHEFGHTLGLDHSNASRSVMAPFYKAYDPNFALTKDDIDGIQSIYGKSTKVTEPKILSTSPPMGTLTSKARDSIVTSDNTRIARDSPLSKVSVTNPSTITKSTYTSQKNSNSKTIPNSPSGKTMNVTKATHITISTKAITSTSSSTTSITSSTTSPRSTKTKRLSTSTEKSTKNAITQESTSTKAIQTSTSTKSTTGTTTIPRSSAAKTLPTSTTKSTKNETIKEITSAKAIIPTSTSITTPMGTTTSSKSTTTKRISTSTEKSTKNATTQESTSTKAMQNSTSTMSITSTTTIPRSSAEKSLPTATTKSTKEAISKESTFVKVSIPTSTSTTFTVSTSSIPRSTTAKTLPISTTKLTKNATTQESTSTNAIQNSTSTKSTTSTTTIPRSSPEKTLPTATRKSTKEATPKESTSTKAFSSSTTTIITPKSTTTKTRPTQSTANESVLTSSTSATSTIFTTTTTMSLVVPDKVSAIQVIERTTLPSKRPSVNSTQKTVRPLTTATTTRSTARSTTITPITRSTTRQTSRPTTRSTNRPTTRPTTRTTTRTTTKPTTRPTTGTSTRTTTRPTTRPTARPTTRETPCSRVGRRLGWC